MVKGGRNHDGTRAVAQSPADTLCESRRHHFAKFSGDKIHRQLDVLEQFTLRDLFPANAANRLLVEFPGKAVGLTFYRVHGKMPHDARQNWRLVRHKAKARARSLQVRIDLL